MLNKNPKLVGVKSVLIIGTLLVQSFSIPSVLAYESIDSGVRNGDISVAACIQKGGQDWLAFLRSLSAADSFDEAYLQPWVDVFGRNQCHGVTVLNLIKQADKAKSEIRDAFLSCRTENIDDAKRAYYELSAEIYYVRHIVDAEKRAGFTKKALKENPLLIAQVFKSRSAIYSEMKSRFVGEGNGLFSAEEFDLVFQDIVDRNVDQRESFVICDRGSWQQVAEKWEEFKAHFTEDLGGLKEFGENVAGEWENIVHEAKTMKIVQLVGGEEKALGDFFKSFVDVSVNGNPDLEYFGEEFEEEFEENLPQWSKRNIVSQNDFIENVRSSQSAFAINEIEQEMKTNFYTLYGTTGDETIELFLNTLDGSGNTPELKEIDGTLEILDAAYPKIDDISNKMGTILDRQCAE